VGWLGNVTIMTPGCNVKTAQCGVFKRLGFFFARAFQNIPAFSFCQRAPGVLSSALRQGPWMEGWQTPPEPEGSNGSLPFLVVVP